MASDPRDAKLIAAWEKLTGEEREAIEDALARPTHVGAWARVRSVKTAMGHLVVGHFVTPLAAECLEALTWNASGQTGSRPQAAAAQAAPPAPPAAKDEPAPAKPAPRERRARAKEKESADAR